MAFAGFFSLNLAKYLDEIEHLASRSVCVYSNHERTRKLGKNQQTTKPLTLPAAHRPSDKHVPRIAPAHRSWAPGSPPRPPWAAAHRAGSHTRSRWGRCRWPAALVEECGKNIDMKKHFFLDVLDLLAIKTKPFIHWNPLYRFLDVCMYVNVCSCTVNMRYGV